MEIKPSKFWCVLILTAICFSGGYGATGNPQNSEVAKNDQKASVVILFIADGMGFEQVKAARLYAGESFNYEHFPYQSQMTTYSANNPVTDSAASATAIATGHKVNDGVLSLAIPGDGQPLKTSLQIVAEQGKSTGLVTTTPALHATPAAFAAHVEHRNMGAEIARDYLKKTRPTVVLGGGGMTLTTEQVRQAGYTTVTNRDEMTRAAADEDTEILFGVFGGGGLPYEYDYSVGEDNRYDNFPHLSEMTAAAISVLQRNENGFFLMVEGGIIDWAGHQNNIERNIYEMSEFANSVQVALDWAEDRDDVLIIVTSDHETGGLKVVKDNGPGVIPDVTWSTGGHTADEVPVYCWGAGAENCLKVEDNTDIFWLTTGMSKAVKENQVQTAN